MPAMTLTDDHRGMMKVMIDDDGAMVTAMASIRTWHGDGAGDAMARAMLTAVAMAATATATMTTLPVAMATA
eukprot:6927129-Pyramimonas_sp.AAC.1